MEFLEELHWILDKEGVSKGAWDEEETRQRIGFVHSMGLKCDSVGWSTLRLEDPRAGEILNRIEDFCQEAGWKARGWYSRSWKAEEVRWYELSQKLFTDGVKASTVSVPCENGRQDTLPQIHAWKEKDPGPKDLWRTYVPARVREACLRQQVPDVRFCWLRDVGKYDARQYFAIYPERQLRHVGVGWKYRRKGFRKKLQTWVYRPEDAKTVKAMGGMLPRVAELFHELHIHLQNCYLEEELPKDGVTGARYYFLEEEPVYERNVVLVHSSLARRLLDERALSVAQLIPALVVRELPAGYMLADAVEPACPTQEYVAENLGAYESFLRSPRPVRMVREKEALTVLRRQKRGRGEDFSRPMPKAELARLENTPYGPMTPYYAICNGAYSADGEYRMLPYTRAADANDAFWKILAKEELSQNQPYGVVIAACANGDSVLLREDGGVVRFSHEEPAVLNRWESLAQFFAEAMDG